MVVHEHPCINGTFGVLEVLPEALKEPGLAWHNVILPTSDSTVKSFDNRVLQRM